MFCTCINRGVDVLVKIWKFELRNLGTQDDTY